jgi:hypothetical protein
VTSRFSANAKIVASGAPFRAVRCDAAAAGARLREQVRKFVSQRLLHFAGAVFAQTWIQRNQGMPRISATRRAAHAPVPFHAHFASQTLCA